MSVYVSVYVGTHMCLYMLYELSISLCLFLQEWWYIRSLGHIAIVLGIYYGYLSSSNLSSQDRWCNGCHCYWIPRVHRYYYRCMCMYMLCVNLSLPHFRSGGVIAANVVWSFVSIALAVGMCVCLCCVVIYYLPVYPYRSGGVIAAIVIGSLVSIAIVVGICVCICCAIGNSSRRSATGVVVAPSQPQAMVINTGD